MSQYSLTKGEETEPAHEAPATEVKSSESLVEGEDYYLEGAAVVFTARYHLHRGYCCENRCRHCPFGLSGTAEQTTEAMT